MRDFTGRSAKLSRVVPESAQYGQLLIMQNRISILRAQRNSHRPRDPTKPLRPRHSNCTLDNPKPVLRLMNAAWLDILPIVFRVSSRHLPSECQVGVFPSASAAHSIHSPAELKDRRPGMCPAPKGGNNPAGDMVAALEIQEA